MAKKILLFFLIILLSAFFIASGYCEEQEIRILYINDFHGFAREQKSIYGDEMVGGIAYLAGMTEKLRVEKPSLLLAAGDMIQGGNWANFFKGESVIKVMNIMGFDAMVIGNHEFDFGIDILKERIKESNFPFLGANIAGMDGIKPYIIKEFKNVKFAIIGVINEDTPITTHPDNVKGIIFLSPHETVESYIKRLKDEVDLVIVLSHLGLHDDMLLAQKVKNIDIIVGGHSHTRLEQPITIENTLIVQAWEHGKVLGVLDIKIKEKKIVSATNRLIDVRPSKDTTDKRVMKIVERYEKQIHSITEKEIGESEIELDGVNSIKRETNFGNLVADIIREKTQADIAIINGGAIKTNIPRGKITIGQIYNALPFDNYLVVFKTKGKELIEILTHGTKNTDSHSGKFPQVSGIKFSFSRDNSGNSKVFDIMINGRPMELDRDYTVATIDFLIAGGDGYKMLAAYNHSDRVLYRKKDLWLRDLVIESLKRHEKIRPVVDGRIKEIKGGKE